MPWSVPQSVGSLAHWHNVSIVQKSKPANQMHQGVFLNILSQAENCNASKCRKSVFGLATNMFAMCLQSYLKFHEWIVKPAELWPPKFYRIIITASQSDFALCYKEDPLSLCWSAMVRSYYNEIGQGESWDQKQGLNVYWPKPCIMS